tara:strand:- start:1623 stop:1742 length:120 start_codon:yes stop_codon:yes gene_type:complete
MSIFYCERCQELMDSDEHGMRVFDKDTDSEVYTCEGHDE